MDNIVLESIKAKSSDALYSSTCFGMYFKNMKEEICNENSATDVTGLKRNYWCNEEFVKYLVYHILPYTPLITHIMFDIRGDVDWFDNQWPAEFWNRIVKIEEQGKNGKTKLSRYIAASKDMIQGRCNDFETSLRKQNGVFNKHLRGEIKSPKTRKVQTGRVEKNKHGEMKSLKTRKLQTGRDEKSERRTPKRPPVKNPKQLVPSASVMDPLSNDVREGWGKKGRQVARPNKLGNEFDNLSFILWSYRAKDKQGFTLMNSCPLDNGLMILTYAYNSFSLIRNVFSNPNVPQPYLQREIVEVINHIRSRRFNEGKHRWMLSMMRDKTYGDKILDAEQQPGGEEVYFDMWGCEWTYVISPLAEVFRLFEEVTSCDVHDDVRRPFTVHEILGSLVTTIIATINGEGSVAAKCREEGCYNRIKRCRVQYQEKIGPVPLVLLTPTVHYKEPTYGTKLIDIPPLVNMFGKVYKLLGVSMLVRSLKHYVSVFPVLGGRWVVYNGMQENNRFEIKSHIPYNDYVSTVWYRLSSS